MHVESQWRRRSWSRRRALAAVAVAVLAATLTACGGSNGSDNKAAASSSGGLTADDSGKLSEKTKVTITVAGKFGSFGPILVDDVYHEFSKRNIDLDVQTVPSTNALPLLTQGKIDGMFTGISASLLNAIQGGADIKVVTPGNFPADGSPSGWYVSTKALNGKTFDPAMLKGQTFASSQGASGTTILGLADILEKAHLKISDVKVNTLVPTDIITALKNGAVFGGNVTAPLNLQVEADHSATQVGPGVPHGYPDTILLFGKTMFDRPAVGNAFMAAYLATAKDAFQGDYINDPKKGPVLAKALDLTEDQLKQQTPWNFPLDAKFPKDYIKSYEQVWREVPGTLTYQGNIDVDKVVDTRFLDWAKSHAS